MDNTKQSAVETSFVRDFFLGNINKITEICEANSENPSEMDQMCTAYIDGVSSEMPDNEKEKIIAPLNEVKVAYTKQALDNFNTRQLNDANENNKVSLQEAWDSVQESVKKEEPLQVQNVKTSIFSKIVKDNVEKGIISPKFGSDQLQEMGEANIINMLTLSLMDPNVSEKNKLKFLHKFITGNTGDETIDIYTEPSKRLNSVMQALNGARQYDSYREEMRKEEENRREIFGNDQLNKAKLYFATHKQTDDKLLNDTKQYLYTVVDPKYYDEVTNLGSTIYPKTTSPLTTISINRMKAEGTWDIAALEDKISNMQISETDAIRYYSELNDAYNQNLKQLDDQLAIARSKLGYTQNTPQNYFKYLSILGPKISDKLYSRDDLIQKSEEALQESLKTAPIQKQITMEEKEDFSNITGLNYQDSNKIFSKAYSNYLTKTNKETATFEEIEPTLRKDLKNHLKYRRKIGAQKDIYDEDGNLIPDDLMIDIQIAKIKEDQTRKGLLENE